MARIPLLCGGWGVLKLWCLIFSRLITLCSLNIYFSGQLNFLMRKDEKSYDMSEDTKWSNQKRKSKYRQTRKIKMPNNDLQNIIQKTKMMQHEPH